MADFHIEIDGLDVLEKKVKSLISAVESKDVEDILLKGAQIVRDNAKQRVHVKTGNLKKGMKAKKGKRRGKAFAIAFAAVDRKIAPHAHLVEYGTAGPRKPTEAKVLYDKKSGTFFGREVKPMPARPFFRPAIDSSKEQVKQTVETGFQQLIEGAVK